MKAIHLGLLVVAAQTFALNSNAQKKSAQDYMKEEAYEAPAGQLFVEADYTAGTSVLNQFDNVIVVNKAAKGTTAQTLKLYSKGSLVLETKVSTGRENVEIVKGAKKIFRKVFGGKGTTVSHWRHTTRGFYSIKRIEQASYRSGESGFQMPYAMFFNDKNGLAVHQVPPDLSGGEAAGEWQLGSRASSGEIDTKTGLQVVNADGTLKTKEGFRTIVIVQELND
jgi:hypothetical protein